MDQRRSDVPLGKVEEVKGLVALDPLRELLQDIDDLMLLLEGVVQARDEDEDG